MDGTRCQPIYIHRAYDYGLVKKRPLGGDEDGGDGVRGDCGAVRVATDTSTAEGGGAKRRAERGDGPVSPLGAPLGPSTSLDDATRWVGDPSATPSKSAGEVPDADTRNSP